MQDEGDLISGYTPWGCAWRVAGAALVVYLLLTAALVLTHAGSAG